MTQPDEAIDLQALLDAASPGPWCHVNPGLVSPKTRTVHGTVPAEPVDYVSTWPGLGTPPGHHVVIPRDAGVRSADMALIAEAPALAAEVLALRAGASEARIKELEAALKDSVTAMRLLLDAVQKHNAESDTFLSGFPLHLLSIEIAAACALLKDGD
jgi:hypothetical protein